MEERPLDDPDALASIAFVIAVNSTENKKCLEVAKSPYIEQNKMVTVNVEECERVSFSYQLNTRQGIYAKESQA